MNVVCGKPDTKGRGSTRSLDAQIANRSGCALRDNTLASKDPEDVTGLSVTFCILDGADQSPDLFWKFRPSHRRT